PLRRRRFPTRRSSDLYGARAPTGAGARGLRGGKRRLRVPGERGQLSWGRTVACAAGLAERLGCWPRPAARIRPPTTAPAPISTIDRKSTRLNSSHQII